MFNLEGRVAVVTGSSAGLGSYMAKALARQGAKVALLARRMEKLEEIAQEIRAEGGEALPVVCDVTKSEDVKAAAAKVVEVYGTVDILVNNAGTGLPSSIIDMPDERWEAIFSLNIDGVMRCTREFGRIMVEKGYGRVINIASVLGVGGLPETKSIAYHASKGAVVNFTRACAAEWALTGVTCNCILPGFFPSEINPPERLATYGFVVPRTPMKRPGRIDELDSTVVYLAADESTYVTGVILPCDGGWTCV